MQRSVCSYLTGLKTIMRESLNKLIDTSEVPHLGPQRRESALDLAATEALIERTVERSGSIATSSQLIHSLTLLWHDHLDASHTISQDIHSTDGSYLHGIMHRREPDFGNAAYWFRRVGDHAIYPALTREVGELETSSTFKSRLIANDCWNPLAMIDACEAVEVEADDAGDVDLLRDVQALEFKLLLERFATR